MRAAALGSLAVLSTLFTLSALAGSGCGSGARRITAADITQVPPGTATGALFSGDYVVTGGAIEGCTCRLGSCSTLHVNVGSITTAVETDGVLQFSSPTGGLGCTGGVDSDGSFRCNASKVQPGDVEYVVANGQFHVANGQPTSMTMIQEVTAAVANYDCDVRASMVAQYSGPAASPAAWEAADPAAAIGFSLVGH
jgi:hypothetical protein